VLLPSIVRAFPLKWIEDPMDNNFQKVHFLVAGFVRIQAAQAGLHAGLFVFAKKRENDPWAVRKY
jgi:hypothetical protein